MNHYERLKVTQDAPREVIHAAYRALAQALPLDELRDAHLMALNAAFEILTDRKARQIYDEALASTSPSGFSPLDIPLDMAEPGVGAAPADVDVDGFDLSVMLDALALPTDADAEPAADAALPDPWQGISDSATFPPPLTWWRQPMVWGVGVLALTAVAGAGTWLWQLQQASQLTRGVAVQYDGAASGMAASPVSPDGMPRTGRPEEALSVEDLSRMSDDELLEVLPTLGQPKASTGSVNEVPSVASPQLPRPPRHAGTGVDGFRGRHPLDGTPLDLRTDAELFDPLAPPPAPTPVPATPAQPRQPSGR